MIKQAIFIIGFSGSGKTTVGLEVSRLLEWEFIDIDQHIVDQINKPIQEIFKLNNGEQYFRELEKSTLKEILQSKNQVISTGGGIILDKENLKFMLDNGYVICLDADPATILNRLTLESLSQKNIVRPLLNSNRQLEKIIELKNQRDYIYRKADYIIKTDYLTPLEVSNEIIKIWQYISS